MTDTNVASVDSFLVADVVRELRLILEASRPKARGKPANARLRRDSGRIAEGARNATLTSLAGSMRHRGMSAAEIEAALQQANRDRCDPPLPDTEVRSIASSIAAYPIGGTQASLRTLNDAGNADRLVEKFGDIIRYAPGLGWYVWNGRFWEFDGCGQMLELAKEAARGIYNEAAQAPNDGSAIARHANNSLQIARLKAMVDLAAAIPSVIATPDQFDSCPMLLNVANGTVDLRTGRLRDHDRKDMITMCAPVFYDKRAQAPRFTAFLREVAGGSKELIGFLKRALGYSLTGETSEQCLFFLYGLGANGKTTFLLVIRSLLGREFALQTSPDTLTHSPHARGATNDLARLRAARVVQSTEVNEGSYFDETLIKQLTGGDRITARHLYKEFFEFDPQFKLLIAGNHKPIIRGTDDGIWRRIYLVPFTQTFPREKRDPHLGEKLLTELPGILNIAIDGCLEWQRKGLSAPPTVIAAVQTYKEDMDILGRWIAESCNVSPGLASMSSALYYHYKQWAELEGLHPMSHVAFSRRLTERGYSKKRTGSGQMVQGLELTSRGAARAGV